LKHSSAFSFFDLDSEFLPVRVMSTFSPLLCRDENSGAGVEQIWRRCGADIA